jgi:hypothetical protein
MKGPEQASLFDEPPQETPGRLAERLVATQNASALPPTPPAPVSQHSESEDADRRSYASLEAYIAGW